MRASQQRNCRHRARLAGRKHHRTKNWREALRRHRRREAEASGGIAQTPLSMLARISVAISEMRSSRVPFWRMRPQKQRHRN